MIKKRIQDKIIFEVLLIIICIIAVFWYFISELDINVRDHNIVVASIGLLIMVPLLLWAVNIIYVYTTEVSVDETGVSWKNIFHKNHLSWEEVKTFGIIESSYYWNLKAIYFLGYVLPAEPKYKYRRYGYFTEYSRRYVEIDYSPFNLQKTVKMMSSSDKKEIIMLFKYTPEDWKYILSLEPVQKLCEEYNYHWDDTGKGRDCYYDPNEEPLKGKSKLRFKS